MAFPSHSPLMIQCEDRGGNGPQPGVAVSFDRHSPSRSCPKYGARTPWCPWAIMEPFGCQPAAMPVGSSAWFCYEIGQCTAYGGSPAYTHVHGGLQRLFRSSLFRTHASSTLLIPGWLRHSPQIFTVVSMNLSGRSPPSLQLLQMP